MTISGRIIDKTSGEGLPDASIVLTDANYASLGVGTKADENGNFTLTDPALDDSSTIVNVSFVGYGDITLPPSMASGTIYMAPSTGSLQEVIVTAKKRIQQLTTKNNWYNISVGVTLAGAVALIYRFTKGYY